MVVIHDYNRPARSVGKMVCHFSLGYSVRHSNDTRPLVKMIDLLVFTVICWNSTGSIIKYIGYIL